MCATITCYSMCDTVLLESGRYTHLVHEHYDDGQFSQHLERGGSLRKDRLKHGREREKDRER